MLTVDRRHGAAEGDLADHQQRHAGQPLPAQRHRGALEGAFKHSKDVSGRQILARNLESIQGMPNGAQMAEDVYLVAVDISMADGSVSPEETAILEKIARRLGVDPKKFEF
jgi:tellurite resistance protein